MSLIHCPDCNKRISDNATSCPNCGCQLTPLKIAELKESQKKQRLYRNIGYVARAIILIILFRVCATSKMAKDTTPISKPATIEENNPYLTKYAGGYTVEINGLNVSEIDDYAEFYILASNGKAKWMMVKKDGQGNVVPKDEQSGTWTATETLIRITASMGTKDTESTEEFELMNGKFINIQTELNVPLAKRRYRYLKRVQNNN